MKRTRLKRVSTKQAKRLREYAKLRALMLTDYPMCFACKTRIATECHHVRGRGKNLANAETIRVVCSPCHAQIHARPKWAREHGYLS